MGEGKYVPGTVCHIEIPAPDLDRVQEFYGEVFGWTFEPMQEGYVFWRAGSLGGAFDREAAPTAEGIVLVLAVDDIDQKLEEIDNAGGRTLQGTTEIGGGMGFYAYFVDPVGNKMGIWMPA